MVDAVKLCATASWVGAALAAASAARVAEPANLTAASAEGRLARGVGRRVEVRAEARQSRDTGERDHEAGDRDPRRLRRRAGGPPGIYTSYDRPYNYLGTVVYNCAPLGAQLSLDMDLECIEFAVGLGEAVYRRNSEFGVVNVVTRTGASVGGNGRLPPTSARKGEGSGVRFGETEAHQ